MPETYLSVLLHRKQAAIRKERDSENVHTTSIANIRKVTRFLSVVLMRPFYMLFTEAAVFFSSLYLALIYGIFYLTFSFW